jgi:predicted ATPase/class 3 adenylate cyclase
LPCGAALWGSGLIPTEAVAASQSGSAPTGTVTFLFTDIEGSTQRWELDRRAMAQAVARHDVLLREALERGGGFVFKTVGDAFCVAFATGPAAIAAALQAQRALDAEQWDAVEGLPVRMALHTGNADERDGDYFGPTVNRVARLLSIAHGGQVVVSGVTADLVQGQLPEQAALRDLGQHRLRDLAYPEQVYQLVAPGLRSDFPPPKSLDTYRHNLPQQLSSFVGREAEVSEIEAQLESTRLVTLVGTGGVGKTRTSLQVGADVLEQYPDGVWFVELAPVRDLGSIEGLLASILGVESTSGATVRQALIASLRGKRALLVFDNCEHVVRDAAQLIEALLVAIPTLRVLASSREGLGIAGESIYRMPSLGVPPAGAPLALEDASRYSALTLFESRAQAHVREFALDGANIETVAELCRRLDGIALAIELAAPRIKFLSPRALLDHLDERFRILTGGSRTALPRQQTMRALIDWSYDLLTEGERQLFRRLSVFVGGWTLDGATAVCTDDALAEWDVIDLLGSLVDKSLVVVEISAEDQRYRMLESTRQYAREKLEGGGEPFLFARRHAEWIEARAAEFDRRYYTTAKVPAIRFLEAELDNVRAALTWTLVQENDSDLGARIAALSYNLFNDLGQPLEGRRWLTLAEDAQPSDENVLGLLALGLRTLNNNADERDTRERLTRAVALLRAGGGYHYSEALAQLAVTTYRSGDATRAEALADEAIEVARGLGNGIPLGNALQRSSIGYLIPGSHLSAEIALKRDQEALRLFRAAADARRSLHVLLWIAELEFTLDPARAVKRGREVVAGVRAQPDIPRMSAISVFSNVSQYFVLAGMNDDGVALAGESLALARSANLDVEAIRPMLPITLAAAQLGELQPAARLFGFVAEQFAAHDMAMDAPERAIFARLSELFAAALDPGDVERLRAEGAALDVESGCDVAHALASELRTRAA